MVIKRSASAEVGTLVAALADTDEAHREAAVARLAVIGARAIDKLTRIYPATSSRAARLAMLRIFEAVGDHRAGPLARRALLEGGDVAVAAAGVLRALLPSTQGSASADALDALISTALDTNNDHRLRLAAFEALQDVPGDVRTRVAQALGTDPAHALQQAATYGDGRTGADDLVRSGAVWCDAIEGRLPEDPRDLRDALSTRAAAAPLNTLRKLIGAVRERESAGAGAGRDSWRTVRGAIHQALALRGSRVALYDLRESLAEGATPLPVSFLAALHVVGDESCLEPLAARWRASDDERWRHQLAEAFRAITRREKIGRGHRTMKKLRARGPELSALLEK
jgi:hypothetical protein